MTPEASSRIVGPMRDTTTVTYRTAYMSRSIPPRTKTFEALGRIDSLTRARAWMQRNGILAISIETTTTGQEG